MEKQELNRDLFDSYIETVTSFLSDLPPVIYERANFYYSHGKVTNFTADIAGTKLNIKGVVLGTAKYYTSMEIDPKGINFFCTCPHFASGHFCKHIGALSLKFLEKGDKIKEDMSGKNRLDLIKMRHKEFQKKNEIKSIIREIKNQKTRSLTQSLIEPDERTIVIELNQQSSGLKIIPYDQKFGVKGYPIKTGRRELGIKDLTKYPDDRFSKLLMMINFSMDQMYIEDIHSFVEVFKGFPYINWEGRKEKVVFAAPLQVKMEKGTDAIDLILVNEEEDIRINPDELIKTTKYLGDHYYPIYGRSGKAGLVYKNRIHPVDSHLNGRQLESLIRHREIWNRVLGQSYPKANASSEQAVTEDFIKKEVIGPLMSFGVNISEKVTPTINLKEATPERKAVWIVERSGKTFTLQLKFSYSGIKISPENGDREMVNVEKDEVYKRDDEFEQRHKKILSENLPNLSSESSGWFWEVQLEDILTIIDDLFPLYSDEIILDCDPKLTRIAHPETSVQVEVKSGINWFEMGIDAKIGDKEIPEKELKELLKTEKKYIEINGEYYKVNKKEIGKLHRISRKLKSFSKKTKESWHRVDILNELNQIENVQYDERVGEIIKMTEDFEGIKEYMLPKGFNGELRNYQKNGYNWLRFLEEFKLNGILADDMGLGKTVQTIVLLLSYYERNLGLKAIIIAPKSLLNNWHRELKKFAPVLKSSIYHGTKTERRELREEKPDIWITTYGTYRNDVDFFTENEFDYCIVDEAQHLKNNQTKTFRQMKKLISKHKIALTGTPVENSLNDLKSLFDFLIPGFFGSKREFKKHYWKSPGLLRQKINPLILRRKKEQVLKELPPKTIKNFYVGMTEKQEELYHTYYRHAKNEIDDITSDEKGWRQNRLTVLKHILRLRQIATHPGMFIDDYADHKNVSGKLESLMELLDEITSEDHKVIVFSQFSTMLALIEKNLYNYGLKSLKIDGATGKRDTIIENFKKNADEKILMMTLKVGGLGLNLTEADYVIIVDPWWNPAAEMQAIDRTHRIGQKNPVMVYRMISNGSIEEKVLELQSRKLEIVENVVDTRNDISKDITPDDIREMFD